MPLVARHAEVNVISPRATDPSRFKIEARGIDTVEIASGAIPSRHYALVGLAGSTRDVWIDEKGRLLKVAIPEKGLVALRDDPPR